MLPIPAITCWSSSSGLRRVDRRRSTAPSCVRRRVVDERVETEAGHLGELDVDVVGVEHDHLAERARVDEQQSDGPASASPGGRRCSTTWVCGGRGAPGLDEQQLAGHAQVDHQHVAGVERAQQVLAAAPGGDERGPGEAVDQGLPRRAPDGALPADLDALDRAARRRGAVEPAPNGLDLGQLRHRSATASAPLTACRRRRHRRARHRARWRGYGSPRRRPPARPHRFERPSPDPSTSPLTDTVAKKRFSWSGPCSVMSYTGGGHAGGGEQLLQRRLEVELVEALGGRVDAVGDQRLDEVVGRGRAAIEVDRPDHRLHRVGEDRRLVPTRRRRPRPCPA